MFVKLQSGGSRLWIKSVIIACVLGVCAAALAFFQFLPSVVQDLSAVFADKVEGVFDILRSRGFFQDPELAKALKIFAAVGLVSVGPIRVLVPLVWPEPPDILDMEISRQKTYSDDPLFEGAALVGRDEELSALMRFAGGHAGDGPCWMVLSGAHAAGKSRLANAWLRRLRGLGWDVGYLANGSIVEITTARFRRHKKTAIVIDEFARRQFGTEALDELLKKEVYLRVLIVDQLPPELTDDRDPTTINSLRDKEQPPLALSDLSDEHLRQINAQASDDLIRKAGGRPLYVLLGEDVERTLRARVNERLAGEGEGAAAYLAFAAWAGPCGGVDWRAVFGKAFPVRARMKLHGYEDTRLIKNYTPPLLPDPFADFAVLHFLETMGEGGWEDIAAAAAQANPIAYFERLVSLSSGPGASRYRPFSNQLWRVYETQAPEHCEARIAEFNNELAQPVPRLEVLERLAKVRMLEYETQLCLAKAYVNKISSCGEAQRFEDLERWGARLLALAEDAAWKAGQPIQLQLAMASVNAINSYGKAQRFEDLERWHARLLALAEDTAWKADHPIQLQFAMASVNAIRSYGEAQRFEDLERWGARLLALTEDPAWKADQPTQLQLAKASLNAISSYGEAQRFEDLERWGAHLSALSEDTAWKEDQPMQQALAEVSLNAIHHHGKAQQFEDLERWGAHLLTQTEDTAWKADHPIQLALAVASVNAIASYGEAQQFEDLERWGAPLSALAEDPAWKADQPIQLQLAKASLNAISSYGEAQRFEDLERWGAHLLALTEDTAWKADHPIQLQLARASVNAIHYYGKAQRFENLERWGAHLLALAENPAWKTDQPIQLELSMASVNAIGPYGKAQRFKDLERWGAHLLALAEDPAWKADQPIQRELSKASANAIHFYPTGPRYGAWRSVLQRCVDRNPQNFEIARRAADCSIFPSAGQSSTHPQRILPTQPVA
ncbi:ATP-binding protein [Rhodobacteraceae bacterium D3-12]|nr:ATP-binding protein [Rhodobacteraceae bacterium D3-12]